MQSHVNGQLPASNGSKHTQDIRALLFPKSKNFLLNLNLLEQERLRANALRSAKVLEKHRRMSPSRFYLFSFRRLLMAHVENQKIRSLLRKLMDCSVKHALYVQMLAQRFREAPTFQVDFAVRLVNFSGACAQVKRLLERWFKLAPGDRKIFRNYSAERIMLGLAATMPTA